MAVSLLAARIVGAPSTTPLVPSCKPSQTCFLQLVLQNRSFPSSRASIAWEVVVVDLHQSLTVCSLNVVYFIICSICTLQYKLEAARSLDMLPSNAPNDDPAMCR